MSVEDMSTSEEPIEQKPIPMRLIIQLNEDGSVSVSGPIGNKVVAYGMLGLAKDAIHQHHEQAKKIERVNGSGGLIQHIRNGFHK